MVPVVHCVLSVAKAALGHQHVNVVRELAFYDFETGADFVARHESVFTTNSLPTIISRSCWGSIPRRSWGLCLHYFFKLMKYVMNNVIAGSRAWFLIRVKIMALVSNPGSLVS